MCTLGEDSWCIYQAVIAQNLQPPSHPNYLGPDAVKVVFDVFDHYNYNKPFFIEQIAEGQTSNNNEALHNILFTMIPKTTHIDYTTMRLGSALAVLRYNEGIHAVLDILNILGVSQSSDLVDFCQMLDERRVIRSENLHKVQKTRYEDRQDRTKRNTRKVRKHGATYDPGKYSASEVVVADDLEDVDLEKYVNCPNDVQADIDF